MAEDALTGDTTTDTQGTESTGTDSSTDETTAETATASGENLQAPTSGTTTDTTPTGDMTSTDVATSTETTAAGENVRSPSGGDPSTSSDQETTEDTTTTTTDTTASGQNIQPPSTSETEPAAAESTMTTAAGEPTEAPTDTPTSATIDEEQQPATPSTGGRENLQPQDETTEPASVEETTRPGSGPGGLPGPGTGSKAPVDPKNVSDPSDSENLPDLSDPEAVSEHVEDQTLNEFQSVDQGEVYTIRDGNQIEARFTERGAKAAVAELLGPNITRSDVTFSSKPGPSGYTLDDIFAEATSELAEFEADAARYQNTQQRLAQDIQAEATVEAAQTARRRKQAARRRKQAARGDIRRGALGDPREIVAEQAAAQLTDRYGFEVRESDINVQRSDGGLRVGIAQDVATAGALAQQAEQTTPGTLDIERTGETEFNVTANAEFSGSQQLEQSLESQLDRTVQPERDQPTGERFGDIDWSFGLGGEGDEVEQAVDTGVDVSNDITQWAGDQAGGFGRGVSAVATAPIRLPGVALEAAETGKYVASDNQGERARKVTQAGIMRAGEATTYYAENWVEGTTLLAGSFVASAGLMGAASKFGGPRLSAATRYSIQPGEEAVKAAARRGFISPGKASLVPGVRERGEYPYRSTLSTARRRASNRLPSRSDISDKLPARSELSNKIRREIQRYRYPRPAERETPYIDLSAEDDVDAVYIQDFRPEGSDDADADAGFGMESDAEGDASNVGTMGTSFDGPVVEVDAGNGQRMLLRTKQQSRSELQAELEAKIETDARSKTELTGLTEASIPTQTTATVTTNDVVGQFVDPVTQAGVATEQPTSLDIITEAQTQQALATDTQLSVATKTALAAETATETGTESFQERRTEAKAEVERETRFELGLNDEPGNERPLEAETDPFDDPDDRRRDQTSGFSFGQPSAGENIPGAGWVNVWATALAGGGLEARSDPSNADDLADQGLGLGLPTQGQVDPSGDLAEGFEAVESLFFLGDGDQTEQATESASGDEDDWGWSFEPANEDSGGGWF